jgi:putative ABC transport system ATP-binding protein
MADLAIALKDVVQRWRRGDAPTLDVPELVIATGERAFLSGPSGTGKSTLLGLLGGVLVPERGTVTVLGQNLAALSPQGRDRFRVDHVGFVFQQFNLVPYLSVLENVLLPCRFSTRRRDRAGSSPHAEAGRLLAALGLAGLGARRVNALSVGQQQRVAAARALIGRPELVIADEPTSSIDAEQQDRFIELLLAEVGASGATVVFVSHDRRLASHFTREIALAAVNRASTRAAA